MPRGRRQKPDALRESQGNPGKRAVRRDVGTPTPDVRTAFAGEFPPPAHLNAAEQEIWRAEIVRVGNLSLLRESDLSAFELYISTLHRWRQAKQKLDTEGLSYETDSKHGKMTRLRPEVAIERDCRRALLNFQRDFAMTSVSRIKAHSVVAATRQPNQPALPGLGADEVITPKSDNDQRGPLGFLHAAGNA